MKGDVINVVTRTNFGRNGINYLKNASSNCPKLEVFAPKSLSSNPDQKKIQTAVYQQFGFLFFAQNWCVFNLISVIGSIGT